MFCPECGKLNPDENQVCQYCNALLIDNSTPPETERSESAPVAPSATEDSRDMVITVPKVNLGAILSSVWKKKFIIIPVLAVVLAFIVFISVGSSMSSPEKVVRKYYTALVNDEYEKMYSYIALPDGEFITKDAYVKYMESNNDDDSSVQKTKDFQVEEIVNNPSSYLNEYIDIYGDGSLQSESNKKDDSPLRNFRVTFVDRLTGSTDSVTVTLIEQEKKKLLFFKNYKISSAGLIIQNVEFEVIGDAQLSVDGIEMDEPEENEEGNDVYKIDAMFRGAHTLTFTSDLYEDYETEQNFNSDNFKHKFYVTQMMKLKSDIISTLKDTSFSTIKTMYQTAKEQQPLPTDKIKIMENDEVISSGYEYLLTSLTPNDRGTGLKSIEFTSAELNEYSSERSYSLGTDESDNMCVSISVNLGFDYSAVVNTGWFTSRLENIEGSGEDSITFQYTYIDGEWFLSYMNTCVVDYY